MSHYLTYLYNTWLKEINKTWSLYLAIFPRCFIKDARFHMEMNLPAFFELPNILAFVFFSLRSTVDAKSHICALEREGNNNIEAEYRKRIDKLTSKMQL